MAIQPGSIEALVLATNKTYDRAGKFTSHAQTLTCLHASKMIEMHSSFVSGLRHTFMIENATASSAEKGGLFKTVTINPVDNLAEGEVKLGSIMTSSGLDKMEEGFNDKNGPDQIIDYIKLRLDKLYRDMYEEMETKLWSEGDSSDNTSILGIPHWITMRNGSEWAAEGFNGSYAPGYTTSAGLTQTQAPGFRNYTDQYANLSYDGLIVPLSRAMRRTSFENIIGLPDRVLGREVKNYFTTEEVIEAVERIARATNTNLGKETGAFTMGAGEYSSNVTFKGIPFFYNPKLEALTDISKHNPIYQVNWSALSFIKQQRGYMDMVEFAATNMPFAKGLAMQSWYQMFCIDRRKLAVLFKPVGAAA